MPNLRNYKILAPEPDFLAFPDHYVNVVGKIAYADLAGLAKASDVFGGEAVIQRGTVVNIDADGNVKKANGNGNGVIFNTVRPNEFDAGVDNFVNCTVLVHGFVRADRLIGEIAENNMIYVVNA